MSDRAGPLPTNSVAEHPLMESATTDHILPSTDEPQQMTTTTGSQIEVVQHADASSPPQVGNTDAVVPAASEEAATDQALHVRGNLLRSIWARFRDLRRGQRWVLMIRLLLSITQIVPAIVILCFPTSLGNSIGRNGMICDPEPIFVFLALHTVRVAASIPVDLYLGLSPHRSARQRRPGAAGQLERERRRAFGSLELDRKASKIADLLGFVHVVLFAVGNYSVWTRTDCSARPADSVSLFWMAFAILAFSYLIIVNIVFLTFMVVFFLPALLALMRLLGLQHRLPTPPIRPETGKIEKTDVEKVTKLVYYIPEELLAESLGGEVAGPAQSSGTTEGAVNSQHSNAAPSESLPNGTTGVAPVSTSSASENASTEQQSNRWTSVAGSILPWKRRRRSSSKSPGRGTGPASGDEEEEEEEAGGATNQDPLKKNKKQKNKKKSKQQPKYPYHPLPAHRSTCPICLVDFESPSESGYSTRNRTNAGDQTGAPSSNDAQLPSSMEPQATSATPTTGHDNDDRHEAEAEVEPLRLLPCGHVLHRSCVDEWLTTVSGRCPVCQRPVLQSDASAGNTAAAPPPQ